MPLYHTTLEINGGEEDVTVEYSTEKASGDGWNEPHIPAHLIIESVTAIDGQEIVLTSKQEDALENEISENLTEADCPPDCD